MRNRRFTYLFISFTIALFAVLASCQKDSDVKDSSALKAAVIDSSAASSPGNMLAVVGTLSIKINDSTYVFDAAKDSIAFINVHDESNADNKYYGITAINKEHTMSFGISSAGFAHSDKKGDIAGSQFILTPGFKETGFQYSLSRYTGQKDFGIISIDKYDQDSTLARGTFHTFLSIGDKANAPVYKAEGTFNLRLK